MMTNVHATDDDLYTGFGREDVAPALETNDLEYDRGFQAAVKSSYGRRPPTSGALKVPGTAGGLGGILASRAGRIQTAGQTPPLSQGSLIIINHHISIFHSFTSHHNTASLGGSIEGGLREGFIELMDSYGVFANTRDNSHISIKIF